MKEIMVAYWSGTGNTAAMATILGKGIQDGGATAKVVSVEDTTLITVPLVLFSSISKFIMMTPSQVRFANHKNSPTTYIL